MRVFTICGLLMLSLLCGQAQQVYASDAAIIKPIVKRAFDSQVQLSERERTLKQIREILNPYFTKRFIPKFLKENLVKTDNGYQTFGTDFPIYYIPFFLYDENTKVILMKNEAYVIEEIIHIQSGPTSNNKNYKGVKLIKRNGTWKVDEVLIDIPAKVLKQLKYIPSKKNRPIFDHKAAIHISFHPIII
ncbi:hypothetical protein J6TS2_02760 [Heyndrickxia sporothermodurans]|nr:hypothetical protein J6TS2_02760 [Heyndrickxia sporothermodurans]